MPELPTVTLKNGAKEVEALVISALAIAQDLMMTHPVAFYELVECCKDPTHQPFGATSEVLEHAGLRIGGVVHASIRHIVLSAIDGHGIDMCLTNPRLTLGA